MGTGVARFQSLYRVRDICKGLIRVQEGLRLDVWVK